ncbi:SLC13 family permease [Paenibacillus melissococcoides]|uniref:Sodium-dependent dicarboxylate transporter SdcS n=1 Tax=Paenibacillus melissococcoides TaxID=2912268 RepID=A0ABM9FXV4_9BACL|nr:MULTISPECIES: SLC13 family permease [Paenibacillus]MEB9894956.1 SLC13 family permease [Bacillus cereus]CAH8244061.1 SLC13 family permease [Paenibacillus melissococcoides]CAH8703938.1 SLC13 family permease [Paenibacillus melissococcoides]CAH8706566.1 SLC13 family permease [Paenibacillus melissococcoides]GIO81654.1 SLC13 family permease [Paenibacillus dendritiformis]
MKQLVVSAWRSLWAQHKRTKEVLTVSGQAADQGGVRPAVKFNKPYAAPQLVGFILGPALFILTMLFFQPDGLSAEGKSVLAVTLWIAVWWITEAIPIPATSLLPLILLPVTGAMPGNAVASSYGNDIIFLFLGGFFIATAMEKWNLHKRMALFIISLIGTSTQRILLGFMAATGFLSMWVSNTAAVMMMVPMGLAITAQIASTLAGKPEEEELPRFEKSLIFGIGYAGTIGGLGTLIGTPPNIILVAQMNELFGISISFAQWMLFAVPVVMLMLISTWFYLGRIKFKTSIRQLPGGRELIQSERSKLGKTSYEEGMVGLVFVFAAFMWITREFLWVDVCLFVPIPGISDGMIAIMAAALLFMIPAKREASSRILNWSDSKDIPWGVLLLFGGGLAIAAGFRSSGLSDWMGEQLTMLDGFHLIVIISCATLLIMMMTEITSNTATATMILPVVAALAIALGIHPFALMIPCAMAANCAFMLPVGTPPNAIIFGTGKLKIIDMVRAGFSVNVFATLIIILAVYYLLPLVFGIDLNVIPESLLTKAQG